MRARHPPARARRPARRSTTRACRSPSPARPRSACRTSSSTSSASRRSCCRSTRPPASSTASAGRSSRRSTRSRPTTAATSTSPPPARSGWMQFMPATWKQYGVDANGDERKDPYNPVDAIFAAARYLKAAGAEEDLRRAIFAYNHADWYVDSVLMRARLIGGLPTRPRRLAHRPDAGPVPGRTPRPRYADDLSEREATKRVAKGHNAARARSRPTTRRRGINIFAKPGSPGRRRPGRQDRQARPHRAPRPLRPAARRLRQHLHVRAPQVGRRRTRCRSASGLARRGRQELKLPGKDPKPDRAPPAPARRRKARRSARRRSATRRRGHRVAARSRKERLFADPTRPRRLKAGGKEQIARRRRSRRRARRSRLLRRDLGLEPRTSTCKRLQGRLARHRRHDPRPHRPHVARRARRTCSSRSAPPAAARRASTRSRSSTAGSCSSRPRSTAPRARTRSSARDAKTPTIGQILLMSKEELERARAHQPAHRDLRLRPPRHPRRRASTAACSPRSSSSPPRGLRPTVTSPALRPRLPHGVGQRLATTRPATPSTSRRSTASRSSATRARARSPTSRSAAC